MHFSELNLSAELLKAIEEIGYQTPTEIQEKSIPLLLEGKDVIGRSHTGTGKTAAFGIPAIEKLSKERKGVEVLILCPTRELAMQACEEIKKFSKFMSWVKPSAVYGGASMEKQIFELKRGANIVIGTPGRVMDHMDRRTLKLENLKTIILDEADEMLNMGFREDIEEILKSVPEEKQTVLFSATMPPAILKITKEFQRDPEIIKVEQKQRTVESIKQYYYDVPMGRKVDAIQLLLLKYEPKLSMIFCNTKKMVDELAEALNARGFKSEGLHGDMKQTQRTQVMNRFKTGRTQILIATDVAARGIDVDDVDAVINYDIPQDNEYYIHRIGRTGRAGRVGTAFTLISGRRQFYDLRDISRYINTEIEKMELPSRDEVIEKKREKITDKIVSSMEKGKYEKYLPMIDAMVETGIDIRTVAATLLYMKLGKELKNIPEFDLPQDRPNRKGSSTKTNKIVLSVGRQNKVAPNFILGALVDATGMTGKSFGKIDIYDKFTTVEVPAGDIDHVIESMTDGKINGNKVTARLYKTDNKSDNKSSDFGDKKRDNSGRRDYRGKSPRSNKGGSNGYSRRKKSQ